jgi:hypothetical protein
MTYQPKPGDIGLTTISGWGGKGIQAAQKLMGCPWDAMQHAFGVTEVEPVPETTNTWIVEAMPEGARRVKNWHSPEHTVYLRCPDQFREPMVALLRDRARKKIPYSWLDYNAIALHHLHIPAPHLQKFIESSGHQICSQLVDWCADKAGWHLFDDNRWPGYVPPCDLWRFYEKQEYAV